MVHWLISIPIPKNQNKQQLTDSINRKLKGVGVVPYIFDIPALRKGSQDSLYSLMDDLGKFDQSIEGSVLRSLKSLKDVTDLEKEEDFIPELILEDGNGQQKKKPVKDYLPQFAWDEKRYMISKELAQTTEKIYRSCTKLDDDLRMKVAEYNSLRLNLAQMDRKDQGTLATKPLDGIVSKENFYESEMFMTYYVVVTKDNYKEWLSTYYVIIDKYHKELEELEKQKLKEKMEKEKKEKGEKYVEEKVEEPGKKESETLASPVVPDSSVLVKEEGELGLFTVIVLKVMAQDFKKACERYKFKVRDFTYDEQRNDLSKIEKEKLGTKKEEMKRELNGWCQSAFSEIFLNWIHLKAVRVFVESILRYGLPPNFVTFLVRSEGKERQIHKIFRDECKELINEDMDENELIKNDFYPYILIPINTQDPLFRFDLNKK